MDEAKKYKIKAFLWDQLVRPIRLLLNIHQLKALLIALTILSVVVFKSTKLFFGVIIPLAIIFGYELYQYYKSGEYIHNYRTYKYPEYKKFTKVMKRSSQNEKQEGEEIPPSGNIKEE